MVHNLQFDNRLIIIYLHATLIYLIAYPLLITPAAVWLIYSFLTCRSMEQQWHFLKFCQRTNLQKKGKMLCIWMRMRWASKFSVPLTVSHCKWCRTESKANFPCNFFSELESSAHKQVHLCVVSLAIFWSLQEVFVAVVSHFCISTATSNWKVMVWKIWNFFITVYHNTLYFHCLMNGLNWLNTTEQRIWFLNNFAVVRATT